MRDMIAMLDGLGAAHTSETVTPGDGQNFTGGATWAPGFPTLVSGPYGLAGLSGAQSETVSPGDGQNFTGGSTWAPGFPTLVSGPYGLADFAGAGPSYSVETVTPGAGQNYTGGAAWAPGFPTLISGRFGLAGAEMGGDPVSRAIRVTYALMQQYSRSCVVASDRLLVAKRTAERYSDWLRGGYGDPSLERRAKLVILRDLWQGLESIIISCSGSPTAGSRVGRTTRGGSSGMLEQNARAAVALGRSMTGNPTNA